MMFDVNHNYYVIKMLMMCMKVHCNLTESRSSLLQSLFHATSLQKTHQSALQVQQKAEVGPLLGKV